MKEVLFSEEMLNLATKSDQSLSKQLTKTRYNLG
jgi:hypothetical protein